MAIEIGDTIELRRGTISRWDFAEFAHLRLLPSHEDEDAGAELLVVVDDRELEVPLLLGQTFPVGDQVWQLDSISTEGRGSSTIRRVA